MLYPNKPTRLTLYTTAGVPALRYTLQSTAKSGKTMRFTPEGAVKVGALPNRFRQLVFRGWRQSLDLVFERDTLSAKETWGLRSVVNEPFGVGVGTVQAFQLTIGGLPATSTITVGAIYRTDWQGTQLLYSTARTNLATYSQLLTQTNPWYLYNATIPSTITAPDGTTTAKVVQEDSTTNSHGIEWSTSSAPYTAGQSVPYVFFVKRNSGTRNLRFTSISGANGMRVTLNLDTLAVANASYGDASFTSGTITPLSNGYYRIDLLGIPSAATSASSQNLYFDMLNAGANTYLGDGTSGLAIWGLMIGAVGSYIPTTTTTITVTDWSVSGTGLVSLGQLPPVGAVLTWSGSAISWVPQGQVPTAAALSDLLRYADAYPVAVEPFFVAGTNGWGFSDGRVYSTPLKLRDFKGVTHSGLEAHITREALLADLPPTGYVDPLALTPTAFL